MKTGEWMKKATLRVGIQLILAPFMLNMEQSRSEL